MDALTAFLSEQTIERIGWVLVHFLWQGVAVGALLWCVLKVLGRASANARYIAACAGLVLVAAAPVATFVIIAPDAPVVMTEASAPLPVSVAADAAPAPVVTRTIVVAPAESVTLPAPSLMETLSAKLEAALPYCVVGWAVGVAVLSVWYLGGWCQLQKLRRIGTKAVSEAVKANASSLWQRLGLRRAVCIVESALVQVPTVIGWLKPVILLPAAALTGLDEVQLTAMIAHELAHIKRCDYGVNIAQTVVEILGFYHPAVWWMSRQIRLERENCCDDMAVALLEDRKEYAKALFSMEEIRTQQRNLAVAANGGHLTSRISRLAGTPTNHQKSGWVFSIIAVVAIMAACILPMAKGQRKISDIPPISPEKLIAKITESEQKIQDIQLHMTGTIPEYDGQVIYDWDWGYDHGKEFNSGLSYSKDRLDQWSSEERKATYDGEVYYQYWKVSGYRESGSISTESYAFTGRLSFNTLMGYYSDRDDRASLSEVLSRADSVSIHEEAEAIDGHLCYVVDVVNIKDIDVPKRISNMRLWIDPERDFRLLQKEYYYEDNDPDHYFTKLKNRISNIELIKMDGVWLPIYGESQYYDTELKPPTDMSLSQFMLLPKDQQRDVGVYESAPDMNLRCLSIDLGSIRFNEGIPPERFTIDFPQGCEVNDKINDKRYVVGQASEQQSTLDDVEWIEWAQQLSVDELIDVIRNKGHMTGIELKKVLAAVSRLVKIGPEALSQLSQELVTTERATTQSFMALILRAIGDPVAVPNLIDALEQNLDSSDYGFGGDSDDSQIETTYKQYQLNPSSNHLGLGRPVREITASLEKLTGHSEGKEHFYAHDSQGNRLGSYTITPEIVDRKREYVRQVAERWRQWWQENEQAVLAGQLPKEESKKEEANKSITDKTRQYGAMAGPRGAELSFAIVPNIGTDQEPRLTKEEYQSHVDDLKTNGPFRGSSRGDSFQWSYMKDDIPGMDGLPVSSYEDKNYILLCARAQYVLRPEFEGKRIWGLEDAWADVDNQGNPVVRIEFDEVGAELFRELTKANVGNRLAMEIGYVNIGICAAPQIMTPLGKSAMITGDFTQQRAEGLAKLLKLRMVPIDPQADEILKEIEKAAADLTEEQLSDMKPDEIVKNLFYVEIGGQSEKSNWFILPDSLVEKVWQELDLKKHIEEGHKIQVVENYVNDDKAIVVTSFIKLRYMAEGGHFVFYLTKEKDRWFINDLDIGDENRVKQDIELFLCPGEKTEGEVGNQELKARNEQREITLPDVEDEAVALDLETGELIEIPCESEIDFNNPDFIQALQKLEKGDLLYENHGFVCLLGVSIAGKPYFEEGVPFPWYKITKELPFSCIVTTGEGDTYNLNVFETTRNAGCKIRYQLVQDDKNISLRPGGKTETSEWSEVVEGVSVRLHSPEVREWGGDRWVLFFKTDLKSETERILPHYGAPLDEFFVELDGQWYKRRDWEPLDVRSVLPTPGTLRKNLHTRIKAREWKLMATGQTMPAFTPGRHTIRIGFPLSDKPDASGQRPRAISNPVEIEIAKHETSADSVVPEETITFPQNWDEVLEKRLKKLGIDPNEHRAMMEKAAAEADPNQMVTALYDVSDLLNPPVFIKPGDDINELIKNRMEKLMLDIKKIVPESWSENDGEGRIDQYSESKLIIFQTPQVHERIQEYLTRKRQQIGMEKFHEKLNTSIDLSSLKGGVPLFQAIEHIQNSVDPPLPIIVAWENLEAKAGVLPTDNVRPSSYVKAPIQDAFQEIFYYLSYNSGSKQPVGYVIDNDRIIIKANPYNLVQKTYPLDPKLIYDESGAIILAKHTLRSMLVGQLQPLMNPDELWRRDARDIMIARDEDILKVITTEQAHLLIAEKLASLELSDLNKVNNPEKQIEIETRFLLVTENFLEDIGLDVSLNSDYETSGGVGQFVVGPANSEEVLAALEQKPLEERELPPVVSLSDTNTGAPGNLLNKRDAKLKLTKLDDLQMEFILRATEAHANAKQLHAPKALVLNGETATIDIQPQRVYIDIDDKQKLYPNGFKLDILPTIQNGGKEVLLKGHFQLSEVLENRPIKYNDKSYNVPYMQVANIPIHVVIKNKETVLIAGPELRSYKKTVTNPGMSKIPVVGRHLSNQSIVDERYRMLLLIKPTVIRHEPVEPEPAIGALVPRTPCEK